mmetsp:Transcript_27212/g.57215  ORF Transcript_27212/g.57215 Transcript_27212/m.57215 type:complete len:1488 (+) Transcript_27212:97-4560(+)
MAKVSNNRNNKNHEIIQSNTFGSKLSVFRSSSSSSTAESTEAVIQMRPSQLHSQDSTTTEVGTTEEEIEPWTSAVVSHFDGLSIGDDREENDDANGREDDDIPRIMTKSPSDEIDKLARSSTSGSSSSSVGDDFEGKQGEGVEEKKVDDESVKDAKAKPTALPPLLTAPKRETSPNEHPDSPFRRALEVEAMEKDRLRRQGEAKKEQEEANRAAYAKQLLRESIDRMDAAAKTANLQATSGTGEVLTRPERNFLESLLLSDAPGAADACAEAHRRLMDADLFFWTICGGAAGELGGRIPGAGWGATSLSSSVAGSVANSVTGPVKNAALAIAGSASGDIGKENSADNSEIKPSDDWVQDWVSRGSSSNVEENSSEDEGNEAAAAKAVPKEATNGGEETEKQPPNTQPQGTKVENHQDSLNSSNTSQGTRELNQIVSPYELQRHSSELRLKRLAQRRRQSSTGGDSNRLFRAHEAGLVVTPQGSARRSLMRMGLPMEKGMYGSYGSVGGSVSESGNNGNNIVKGIRPPPLFASTPLSESGNGHVRANSLMADVNQSSTSASSGHFEVGDDDEKAVTVVPNQFEKELAKMDERTIRRIEREEREKQKRQARNSDLTDPSASRHPGPAGCISPFSMNILRKMYASKQFSFFRQSSSYTRYDSFLTSKSSIETSANLVSEEERRESNSTVGDVYSSLQSDKSARSKDRYADIFRPSSRPKTSEERLRILLVQAGLQDPNKNDMDFISDSSPEGDLEVMSTSTNSVAVLINGGPDHWDGEEDVFRIDEKDESGGEGGKNVAPLRHASLVSSLGSKSAASGSCEDFEEEPSPPAKADLLGELPPARIPTPIAQQHKRSSTIGIMKRSNNSGSTLPSKKSSKYKRSVSWGHMVFPKENDEYSHKIEEPGTGLSIISFPNIKRAAPLRSDSIGSNASAFSIPPLRLGNPLRSESMGSVASFLSSIPALSRAHPVFSPRNSISLASPPPISHAHAIRSDSQGTLGAELDEYSAYSFGSYDVNSRSNERVPTRIGGGAAWTNPLAPRRWLPPRHNGSTRQKSTSSSTSGTPPLFIRQASKNDYEGEGMEIEEPDLVQVDSLDSARNFKSMVSMSEYSAVSTRSRVSNSSKGPAIQSLDDNFIIRNIDFERHTSEILRSLSNEDLYTSHNMDTISTGARSRKSSKGDAASVARVYGDLYEAESWEMQSNQSFSSPQNAWNVTEDDYAVGYGANNTLPFKILGTSADDTSCHPHVLSPPLMESLQNFFPPAMSENNFWLKYSLVRDGASLYSLLRHVRGAKHTLIGIETVDGEVFGCFTSSPWRKNWNYYGEGECFLWRMRRTRSDKDAQYSILDQAKLESELDVFFWTGKNEMIQYCTHDMIAIGGGTFDEGNINKNSSNDEERDLPPQDKPNPIFAGSDKGGFGLAIDSELLRGTSSCCATFQSPPLSKAHANGSPFEIVNLEVWTMTPCDNVADAENLEMKKLFLESYSAEIGPSS